MAFHIMRGIFIPRIFYAQLEYIALKYALLAVKRLAQGQGQGIKTLAFYENELGKDVNHFSWLSL